MEASDLEIILSGCLKLEFLELKDHEILSGPCICSQNLKLKCLSVCSFDDVAKIELSVPNLEMFLFEGYTQDFTFSGLHQLKNAAFSIHGNSEESTSQLLNELSKNVPHLHILLLTWCSDRVCGQTFKERKKTYPPKYCFCFCFHLAIVDLQI